RRLPYLALHFLLLGFAVVLHGQDAGDLALGELQPRGVLERAGGRLEAEVEQLLPRVGQPVLQLVVGQVTHVPSPQTDHHPRASRTSTSRAASARRGAALPWQAAPTRRRART